MNESDFNQLLEAAWGRQITPDEHTQLQAWFDHHPEAVTRWRDEASLTAVLEDLPDVSVPSNFTALVLAALDREPLSASRLLPWDAWFSKLKGGWLPRLAGACLLLVFLGLAWQQYHHFRNRQASRALVWLSFAASTVPEPQVFRDFDAVRWLGHTTPPNDDALFAVLNQ